MPRYTVGHLDRVAAAEAALEARPEIVLAGAAFHGVGVPDCIARGQAAAERVIALAERVAGSRRPRPLIAADSRGRRPRRTAAADSPRISMPVSASPGHHLRAAGAAAAWAAAAWAAPARAHRRAARRGAPGCRRRARGVAGGAGPLPALQSAMMRARCVHGHQFSRPCSSRVASGTTPRSSRVASGTTPRSSRVASGTPPDGRPRRPGQPPRDAASSLIRPGPTRQQPPTRRAPAATQRRAESESTSGPVAGSQRPVPGSQSSPEFG